jgi:hypothetical protein
MAMNVTAQADEFFDGFSAESVHLVSMVVIFLAS